LKAGKYDIAYQIPTDLYKTFKDLDNLQILGRQELYYSYMGFKVGKFDKAKGMSVVDPNAKMSDIKLRQALAYGLDVEQMVKAFYHGLRERATTSIPPVFKKYYTSFRCLPYISGIIVSISDPDMTEQENAAETVWKEKVIIRTGPDCMK